MQHVTGPVDLAQGRTLPGAWTAAWAADPDRAVLLTVDGRVVSAAELAERTAAAAGRYAAAGLVSGHRVLMSARPSVELVVAYVGALRYGLTVVPANPAYTGGELSRLVAEAAPAMSVLDDPHRLPGGVPTDLAALPPAQPDPPLDRAAPGDVALVVYTSGTTGRPKGAPLTHANLLAGAHAVRLAWRWTAGDRLVLCLPLFHVHGLGVGLHGTLTAGASAVLLPGFDPAGVAAAIREHRASLFFGVPTMYHRLAATPHLSDLRAVRLAVSGSAPLPADLYAAVERGTGQRILERYGMTETVMLTSNPYEGERRPGTVGFPLPGVDLRMAPRPGGVHEIEVTGPNVIARYLDGAGSDAFTADGWFRTGDLGTLDGDGYLRISGRAKELIITGGYNVYPREVEETLRAHPAVADVAVAGVASAEWGETVVAFVVPTSSGAGPALRGELTAWCAARLAPYKRPRDFRWVDTIPRNALGKVLRHQLTG